MSDRIQALQQEIDMADREEEQHAKYHEGLTRKGYFLRLELLKKEFEKTDGKVVCIIEKRIKPGKTTHSLGKWSSYSSRTTETYPYFRMGKSAGRLTLEAGAFATFHTTGKTFCVTIGTDEDGNKEIKETPTENIVLNDGTDVVFDYNRHVDCTKPGCSGTMCECASYRVCVETEEILLALEGFPLVAAFFKEKFMPAIV